jgi:hypothetical protein
MKKLSWVLIITILVVGGLHAVKAKQSSGITGTVSPAEQVTAVWAIGGADTIKTTMKDDHFVVAAGAGTYKLVIKAKAPYKDALLDNIIITEGKLLDVGAIQLKQ